MSMYLSRLILDPRSRDARRDLADCQALHHRVMTAFPAVADPRRAREQLGVLYRAEEHPRTGITQILVQSASAPDWSGLPKGYLADTRGEADNPACRRVDEAWAAIGDGTPLAFRLRANPTKRINEKTNPDDKLKGQRVELQTEAEWLGWLERKACAAGFELLSVEARSDVGAGSERRQRIEEIFGFDPDGERPERIVDTRANPATKVHGGRRETGRLTFGAVLFEGRLRVTDADRFREALARGIGPAKAYGFGLLSIAPAR